MSGKKIETHNGVKYTRHRSKGACISPTAKHIFYQRTVEIEGETQELCERRGCGTIRITTMNLGYWFLYPTDRKRAERVQGRWRERS